MAETTSEAAQERGSATILVVEDDLSVRQLARLVLESRGYVVLTASGFIEANKFCQEHRGPIDLLLTDIVMPNVCGGELATVLQRCRPDMKVLFMSGHTEEMICRHGLSEDSVPLLRKPFTIEMLDNGVKEALAAKAPSAA